MWIVLAGLVVAAVVAAWVWRSQRQAPPAPQVSVPAPVLEPEVPAAQAPASAVKYPIEEVEQQQALTPGEIPGALSDLVGARAVQSFLQTEGFPRRLVATIDSLGREHSPPAAWPVMPTPGRFTVEEGRDGPVLATDNASRYTPFVLLASTLDVPRTVNIYRRMYPMLQQAYRDLGFGDRYLNDRVIEVIDLLLATPEPVEPPRLELTPVQGPIPSVRPWVRYRFVDPRLEALASGQKILVRVGPVNQRRLKAKLRELREQLVGAAPPAAAAPIAAPPAAEPPAAAPSAAAVPASEASAPSR